MEKKMMYGVVFSPTIINNKIVMLKPLSLIDGCNCCFDGQILDKFNNTYYLVRFSDREIDYNRMYGFNITEEELHDYATNNFRPDIANNLDICAAAYLGSIKDYVFLIEKGNDQNLGYALNIETKDIRIINFSENAIYQLPCSFPNVNNQKSNKKKSYTSESVAKKDEQNISSDSKNEKEEIPQKLTVINPNTLYKRVIRSVIGQDEAAFTLSTTIYKNMKYGHHYQMKSNILIYGPSGCGKTELVRCIAKELNVPMVIEDMTSYTASGYVGDSVKKILRRLLTSSKGDIKKAEKGIIVLDEIDKLASTDSRESVNKSDVQEELLKMIEGGKFDISDYNRNEKPLIIDTSNITFILCGAFSKFRESKKKNAIGFRDVLNDKIIQDKIMTNDDLIKYGLITELVGRITVKVPINQLTIKDYEDILNKSSVSCLRVYEQALKEEDKITIVYNDKNEFINKVAIKAEGLKSGARALKTVVDDMFIDVLAEISKEDPVERNLIVSSEFIDNPKVYQLKKVRRGNENELSKRNGECNK